MIEWALSTTEALKELSTEQADASLITKDLREIFSLKIVEDSIWKHDILMTEERVSLFSEKITKKALQKKQKYSLLSQAQFVQMLCHKSNWVEKALKIQMKKKLLFWIQSSHYEVFSEL